MSGQTKDPSSKNRSIRRIYFCGLITAVTFVAAMVGFQSDSSQRESSATLHFSLKGPDEDSATAQKSFLDQLQKQLSTEQLTNTLKLIDSKTGIKSDIFADQKPATIRERLMSGLLKIEPVTATGQSDQVSFRVSLTGSGSPDESLFVELLVQQIRDGIAPLDPAAMEQQLDSLHQGLLASSKLNQNLRASFDETLMQHTERQQQLLANARRPLTSQTVSVNENWELKNLREQWKMADDEYQSNAAQEFAGKQEVQENLRNRKDYLDQEIRRLLKAEENPQQRLADSNSVEKATFVDSGTSGIQPFELEQQLITLKSESALLTNRMDIAATKHLENLQLVTSLVGALQQTGQDVRCDSVSIRSQGGSSNLLLFGLVSCVIGVFVVSRIRPTAFDRHYSETESIENSLQLPVLGQASLPGGGDDRKSATQQIRLIRTLTRSLEWILAAAILLAVMFLMRGGTITELLADPAQLLNLFGPTTR